MSSLAFSIAMLTVVNMAAGIFMVQMLSPFMENEDNDPATQEWVYLRFGSAGRATYTMFEATLTGTWTASSRRMIEDVDASFALFWVFYVIFVSFAMMRVVAALFLKHTMAAAANDEERVKMATMKDKE